MEHRSRADAAADNGHLQGVDDQRGRPWVDPDRIGVFGGSYGGFVVLSCLSRLAELNWAAGVDVCGPSNLVTFTRAQPPTWRHKVTVMIGDPDTDEEFLRSRSPVTYADDVRAPLFVIQGANDPNLVAELFGLGSGNGFPRGDQFHNLIVVHPSPFAG